MKKLGIIVGGLAALGALATPYWIGVRAEQVFQSSVQQFSNRLPDVNVVTTDYRRGWFRSEVQTHVVPVRLAAAGEIPVTASLTPVAPTSSRAETPIKAETPMGAKASVQTPPTFVLHHTISHGPFAMDLMGEQEFWKPLLVFVRSSLEAGTALQRTLAGRLGEEGTPPLTVHSEMELSGEDAAEISELLGGAAPLQVDTTIGFDGSGASIIRSPAFVHPLVEEGEGSVDWKGLDGVIHFNGDLNEIQAELRMPGLTVTEVEDAGMEEVRIEGMELKGDWRRIPLGLWTGSGELRLGLLEANPKDENDPGISIQGISVFSDFQVQGAVADIVLRFGMDSAAANVPDTGAYEFSLGLQVSATGLDSESLARLEAVSEQYGDAYDPDAGEIPAEIQAALGEFFSNTLQRSPTFSIDNLRLRLDSGEINASARLGIDGKRMAAAGGDGPLLAAVEGKADVQMPVAVLREVLRVNKRRSLMAAKERGIIQLEDKLVDVFAEQHAAQQMQGLVDSGFVVVENGIAKTSAVLQQGRITLNGKPLPIALTSPVAGSGHADEPTQ